MDTQGKAVKSVNSKLAISKSPSSSTKSDQLASLTKAIEGLTKQVQEQDAQIARLISKVDNVDTSHIMGKQVEAHDEKQRWRNLRLNCKDKLSEASDIEMCIQDMHLGLVYILQGILSKSFEELATRAHDMELSITTSGVEGPPVQESLEPRKNKN
ncbi:UNVERIFIED_CONTAM: hypothetical protein Scaly_1165500 [Sesamum calycinum]|uniref:Uncharacterized protein n=1 Tax=Sesamum calycinum TaxID=2727403 RepID=A0AAW2Q2X6_9LAMI